MAKKQSPASQSTDSMIVWGQILLVHFRLGMSNIISSLENMYSMVVFINLSFAGLLIFRGNFAGFSGANSWKNRLISREKSQNSRKNRSISRDFSGKNSNFEGFSGANS